LASAFNAMLDKLEAAFAAQRRFTANAAHELLTPLTALRGSLEVLLRGAQDDPAAVTRLSKGMYAEVTRLIRLCEQLLGLARLESSANLRKKTVHLRSFFRTFVQQAKRLAPQRKVSVAEGPDITLQADPDMLQQILLNLFTNALNHSSPDTAIVFSWRLLPGRVEILVRDFGSGIPKEVLPHVFEPFFSASPERRGAGLGLALVKSMTEAHGGSVTIESEEGAGTTVRIVLPLT
jgi:two-component system OmpR family sensor kinase